MTNTETEQILRGALAEIGMNVTNALNATVPDQETQDTYENIRDIVDSALGPDPIALHHTDLLAACEAYLAEMDYLAYTDLHDNYTDRARSRERKAKALDSMRAAVARGMGK